MRVHFPVEVRFVQADEIYLSPASGRDSCYINVIMYRPYGKHVEYQSYWDAYEKIMREAGGRPHWAKVRNHTFFCKPVPTTGYVQCLKLSACTFVLGTSCDGC